MRVSISFPPLPEYPASDPEAEVTVTFATKLLLKSPTGPDCLKDIKSTVATRLPVVPPVPVRVSVRGVLEAEKLPGVVWVKVTRGPVRE
jgi:hypothetical protein